MIRRGRCVCVGRWIVALLLVGGLPGSGVAQDEWLALGPSAAWSEVQLDGFEPERDLGLSGLLYGGEIRGSWWRLVGRGEYRQGLLDREAGGGTERVIQARGSVGVRALSWLTVSGGPILWRIGTAAGVEEIVRWRVGVRGEGPLIEDIAIAFADLSGSVAGTRMKWEEPPGAGGDVGLLLRVPGAPVWATVGYRLDREVFSGAARQTIETIYLSIGLSALR